ncbi:hypothetical protein GGX14DRAFT_576877 [Mycena pura]|uniref:polynucleotide adenylyltransferase n=1 Tax=Mycena pura TaxID=153505 RepID=A0AAD6UW27_9AGAR|nr:hypothetical protein GGX14DRAFT_576877 [Mycena pura]
MAADIPSRRRKRTEDSGKAPQSARFEDGADFIFLEDTEERDSRDRDWSSRRKDREGGRTLNTNGPRSRSRSPSPRQRESDSRRRRSGDRPREENGHTREWDRGKRKYDMVFDSDDTFRAKKQRTDPKSRLTPWVDGVDWDSCKTPADMFHREVESFVNWISPTSQEHEIRGLVVAIISRAVTAQFPDAEVLPFGSYATKLYLPLGDIDLVIRSPSMAYSATKNVLSSLAATIKRSQITEKVTIIAKAKVPIVKFVTSAEYGRFNVDLSINQENGIVAGKMINGFLRDFSGGSGSCLALRALVFLTKLFLSQRGMNEVYTGGLGSYAIVCMCISFLQMHPKIRYGHIDPDLNLGVLVVEFFELYGTRFHYDEVGISVRNGGSYFGKRQRGWGWGERWGGSSRGSLLSIEDPGDPSNDISSGSYNFRIVRQNLAGAHGILTATIYLRAGILEARRKGQVARFRDRYEPGDMSILSSVLGVTQEASTGLCAFNAIPAKLRGQLLQTLNNRALVKEVYEGQALHKLMGIASIPQAPTPPVNGVDRKPKPKSSGKRSRTRTPVVVVDSASTPNGKSQPQSEAQSRASSMRNVWAEADMEMSDDARPAEPETEAEAEAEGRYAIGVRAPPKKRRRTGRHREDRHAVTYTADSDDSDDNRSAADGHVRTKPNAVHEEDKTPDDAGQLRIKGMGSSSSSSLDPGTKRDYWLSKGIGPGGSSSDS